MSFSLIYPAIIVFILLLIGLVLTVLEFKKNTIEADKNKR